jgi:hypothetical protein
MPGAWATTLTVVGKLDPADVETTTDAFPIAVSQGTWKLIWLGPA